MLGLTNITLGIIYRLPMPLQPKKIIAVTAITQGWPPNLVYSSGFGLGVLWIVLSLTGLLKKLIKFTPDSVVRGIQLALSLSLAWQAIQWIQPSPLLGIFAVIIVIVLRENRYAPASILLMILGFMMVYLRGDIQPKLNLEFSLPPIHIPNWQDTWQAMLLAGFAQIPLSVTNAIIAPAALIREYFPDKTVEEKKLMLNMGIINIIGSLFSGMPMCHGTGGLAGQYYFGARTGGAAILEGIIEVFIGMFLSKSISQVLANFPMPLISGMVFLVAIQLAKPICKLKNYDLISAIVTAMVSLMTNIGIGFIIGIIVANQSIILKNKPDFE